MSHPQEHKCSGELVDDGAREYFVCDDADSPRCPSHKATCTDCGKKTRITCYRGEEPLCGACEEEAYGPREREDWRESSGRCTSCKLFYDLICSEDRKDLCYTCAKVCMNRCGPSAPGSKLCYECIDGEPSAAYAQFCDECGKSVVNGRLTCLCPYEEEDLKKMDRQLLRQ